MVLQNLELGVNGFTAHRVWIFSSFIFHIYISTILCILFFVRKCRLFWSEGENFCRSLILFKNALYIIVFGAKYSRLLLLVFADMELSKTCFYLFRVPVKGRMVFREWGLVGTNKIYNALWVMLYGVLL